MMFDDVVQLLNQKSGELLEKKEQLEQEMKDVESKMNSVHYLIEFTKRISEGEVTPPQAETDNPVQSYTTV